MTNEKDKIDIQNAKKRIEEQIEATKKQDLGLDADGSSQSHQPSKSLFNGFINPDDSSSLDGK